MEGSEEEEEEGRWMMRRRAAPWLSTLLPLCLLLTFSIPFVWPYRCLGSHLIDKRTKGKKVEYLVEWMPFRLSLVTAPVRAEVERFDAGWWLLTC